MNPDKFNKRITSLSKLKEHVKAKDLYKFLIDDDAIWYQAYQNIYSNRGAFTKGINSDTLDGFDKNRISKIISSLKDKSYQPTPVRRVLIPKSNGKTRPLGIPTGTDKLVQEACRIILEAIYEPKFSNLSHGFRPNRSCHTALKEISKWTGTKWFIEFDIKGCFDNIDHDILLSILKERIENRNFIELVNKFLKAGYINNWKYNATYSGTPQGGIISPILANIYLDRLDKYIENKCNIINATPKERKYNKDYSLITSRIRTARNKYKNYAHKVELIEEYIKEILLPLSKTDKNIFIIYEECYNIEKEVTEYNNNAYTKIKRRLEYISNKYNLDISDLRVVTKYHKYKDILKNTNDTIRSLETQMYRTKAIDTSTGLERLHYVRYADDFILGYIGTKKDANNIYNDITKFVNVELKLDIAENKSGIKDKNGVLFLGYKIEFYKYTGNKIKVNTETSNLAKRRNIASPVFKVPVDNIISFVKNKGYGSYVDNQSEHRTYLMNFDVIEIVKQYNAELRGLMQYYRFALNGKDIIGRVQWLWQYSLFKTIANKHKCTVAQLFTNNIIKTENNINGKRMYIIAGGKEFDIFNIKTIKYERMFNNSNCNDNSIVKTINIRSSALKKLIADSCEVCGKSSDDVKIVLHHWNPIRNIPETDTFWNKVKKMRQRKTIAVCHECHMRIHHG